MFCFIPKSFTMLILESLSYSIIFTFLVLIVFAALPWKVGCAAYGQEKPFRKPLGCNGTAVCADGVPTFGFTINPNPKSSLRIPAMIRCVAMCKTNPDCTNVNFRADTNWCELFNFVPTNFFYTPNCVHFQVDKSCSCYPFVGEAVLVQESDGSGLLNRPWADFKAGYRADANNFWLGNDCLHYLTNTGKYKLRFELQSLYNGLWYVAEYSTFVVDDEAAQYAVHFGGYTGNATDQSYFHQGMKFTTVDHDNDYSGYNCAQLDLGGWWHKACALMSVNTKTTSLWDNFYWFGLPDGSLAGWKTGWKLMKSQMWLIPL